jgi:four helix bundle protein
MDNIAEGFERGSNGEFKTFLAYAKGSAGECRSQLHRCLDQGYISEPEFNAFKQEIEFISGKLQRIIDYLNGSGRRGSRF